MRIGVDLMGSESSPEDLFYAVLEAQKSIKGISALVVFARPEIIKMITSFAHKNKPPKSKAVIRYVPAEDVIEMNESPSVAIRRKKKASMLLGLKMMAEKQLDAFVTAGNTGALVVGSKIILKTLPGVERPGLLALLPSQKSLIAVIDVGGNVDCGTDSLVNYAKMGIAFQQAVQNKPNPSIGLLNIGVESIKGTSELREAYQILNKLYKATRTSKKNSPHFLGNIEGKEVFEGKVDVLVTDGFTGNVFLKTSEGISKFILSYLKKALITEKSIDVLEKLQSIIHYEEYPGALLCGVEGVVIKCHGCSSQKAVFNGIKGAADLVQNQIIEKLRKGFQ